MPNALYWTALFCVLAFLPKTAVRADAPRLACDQPVHDFGAIGGKDAVEHTFVLRNAGTGDLAIWRVQNTCGCTTTRLQRETIAPGEELPLTASFSLRGRRGPQYQRIFIHSNDPLQPRYELALQAVVQREIDLLPPRLFFKEITGAPLSTLSVRIENHTPEPVRLVDIELPEDPRFTVDQETLEPGKTYRLHVTPCPETRRPGLRHGRILIHTDHSETPVLELAVSVFERDALHVHPPELEFFLPADADRPLSRHLLLRSAAGHEVRLTAVDPPLPDISVHTETTGPGQYRIRLDGLTASAELQGRSVRLRVKTREGETVTLEIPCRVRETGQANPPP